MRYIIGAFIASILVIASYTHGPKLLGKILDRGNETVWGDKPKQPEYRQMGRIYTTDIHGVGIRREPDTANVEDLEAAGRKVFTTKGERAWVRK